MVTGVAKRVASAEGWDEVNSNLMNQHAKREFHRILWHKSLRMMGGGQSEGENMWLAR